MRKTQSKLLAERHGKGTAWKRHFMCELALRLLWTRNRPVVEISIWQHKNIHTRQTAMSPVRSELAIPASDRSQTHPLDRKFTGSPFQAKAATYSTRYREM
jgi:hypothetical protein